MIVVKSAQQEEETFEFFDTYQTEDASGNTVTLKRPIGRWTLAQLEEQKAKIQEKIDAINALE